MYDNRTYKPQSQKRDYPDFNFDEPFFTGDGLNLKWVGEKAKEFSIHIAEHSKEKMTTSALRNFYNEMLRILNIPAHSEKEKLALIRLLVAKVNYKKKQLGNKIPREFVDFMSKLVDQIQDNPERFAQACLIMEAVVGYNPKK